MVEICWSKRAVECGAVLGEGMELELWMGVEDDAGECVRKVFKEVKVLIDGEVVEGVKMKGILF